jgi:hypothetical protein
MATPKTARTKKWAYSSKIEKRVKERKEKKKNVECTL